MSEIDLTAPGWRENTCYPGTHWLFYDQRRNYVARVDFAEWMKGRYQWRFMPGWPVTDVVGYADTLEDAQKAAETARENYQRIKANRKGAPVQLSLFAENCVRATAGGQFCASSSGGGQGEEIIHAE